MEVTQEMVDAARAEWAKYWHAKFHADRFTEEQFIKAILRVALATQSTGENNG